jgi:hypothetical protein
MRHRAMFLAGLGVGLVAGMQLGRERYDQLKALTQKVAGNPSVQKATKAAGQKAGELTKAAGQQAADKLPKLTETARTSAGKVISQFSRNHDDDPAATGDSVAVNGAAPSSRA